MKWYEKCLLELTHHNMFESTEHRSRFLDLVSCYYQEPFFTKGLCKCMYLASWDEEHFEIMLSTLNEMVISGTHSLREMAEQGYVTAMQSEGSDAEIMKLATSFISDYEYTLPDFSEMDPDGAHIIRQAILAGRYIDDLPDPRKERKQVSA